jgi:hypothetical protein
MLRGLVAGGISGITGGSLFVFVMTIFGLAEAGLGYRLVVPVILVSGAFIGGMVGGTLGFVLASIARMVCPGCVQQRTRVIIIAVLAAGMTDFTLSSRIYSINLLDIANVRVLYLLVCIAGTLGGCVGGYVGGRWYLGKSQYQ